MGRESAHRYKGTQGSSSSSSSSVRVSLTCKQLCERVFCPELLRREAMRAEVAALPQRHHLVRQPHQLLRPRDRRLDALVLDQRRQHVPQHALFVRVAGLLRDLVADPDGDAMVAGGGMTHALPQQRRRRRRRPHERRRQAPPSSQHGTEHFSFLLSFDASAFPTSPRWRAKGAAATAKLLLCGRVASSYQIRRCGRFPLFPPQTHGVDAERTAAAAPEPPAVPETRWCGSVRRAGARGAARGKALWLLMRGPRTARPSRRSRSSLAATKCATRGSRNVATIQRIWRRPTRIA